MWDRNVAMAIAVMAFVVGMAYGATITKFSDLRREAGDGPAIIDTATPAPSVSDPRARVEEERWPSVQPVTPLT